MKKKETKDSVDHEFFQAEELQKERKLARDKKIRHELNWRGW